MAATNSTDTVNDTNNDNADDDSMSISAPKIVFLLTFMLVGILGNVILIITIGGHRKHRTSSLHIFILNLALVNCLDCFINMSFTLGSNIATSWEISGFVCKLNAFFMNLVWIETLLGLTFMTLDRMMATKHLDRYEQIQNTRRIILMIIYTWVHSFLFSLPLLVGAVPMKVYPDINICIVSEKTSIVYTSILSLGCFLIPLIVSMLFFIVICKINYKERTTIRMKITQQNYSKDVKEPTICKEIKGAKFSGVIFLAWILMQVPFVVALLIHLFRYSDDLSINSGVDMHYTWYISISLLWVKFGYVMVLPVCALVWKKELWQNFKDLILCRKSNMIVDVNGKEDMECMKEEKGKIPEGKDDKMKEAFVHNSGFQVPVLFATANGVHIQTYDPDETESDMMYEHVGIRGKKCDVMGSQGQLLEDDTSDYDSSNELDPFSVSHPVSARNLDNMQNNLQKRSNSQPEVRENKVIAKQSRGSTQYSITTTSAVDSGLDISTDKVNSCSNEPKTRDTAQNLVIEQRMPMEDSPKTNDEGESKHVSSESKKSNRSETNVASDVPKQKSEPEIKENHHSENSKENQQILSANLLVTPSPKSKRKKKQGQNLDSTSAIIGASDTTRTPQKLPPRLEPLSNLYGVSVIGGQLNLHTGDEVLNTEAQPSPPGKKYRKLPSLSQSEKVDKNTPSNTGNTSEEGLQCSTEDNQTSYQCSNISSKLPSFKVNLGQLEQSAFVNGEMAAPVTPSACDLMDIGRDLTEAASMSQSKELLVDKED